MQELAAKYIKWEICTSSIWLCVGIALGIICLIMVNKSIKAYRRNANGVDWGILALLCGIISLAMIGTQTHDIIKCIVFPEFQLFGFVQGLLQ